jgi:hypothetical protein
MFAGISSDLSGGVKDFPEDFATSTRSMSVSKQASFHRLLTRAFLSSTKPRERSFLFFSKRAFGF